MASIEVKGVNAANLQLEVTAREIEPGIRRVLRQIGEAAKSHMEQRYLSGSPLKVRTDVLRSGWNVYDRDLGRGDYAVVVGTKVQYAAVHNYGFKGVQQVKAHTRARRAAGGGRPPARSRAAKLQRRSEARARSEHRSRLNQQSRESHGMSRSQLKRTKLQQRKDRGIQRGGFGARPTVESGSGRVAVRAHDRYMKLRGHRYVERTLRDIAPLARKLLDDYQRGLMQGRART